MSLNRRSSGFKDNNMPKQRKSVWMTLKNNDWKEKPECVKKSKMKTVRMKSTETIKMRRSKLSERNWRSCKKMTPLGTTIGKKKINSMKTNSRNKRSKMMRMNPTGSRGWLSSKRHRTSWK